MCVLLAWGGLTAPAVAQFTPDVPAPPPSLFRQAQAADPPPVQKVTPNGNGTASEKLPAPTAMPAPGAASPMATLTEPGVVGGYPPLPGTIEDTYQQELEARRGFATYTWRGTRLTAFPNTLLWEPPLAVKKDPRMQFLATDQSNYRSSYTIDTWIGGTQGLWRVEPEGADFAAQVDIFGLVLTRLSPDDLMAADYRFGVPLSWRWGWWQGKVGYEHTSAHLGDEIIAARGLVTRSFAKDEVVLGFGRFVYDDLRVYGHLGYAFSFQVPDVETTTGHRFRYDVGFEWYNRCPTGFVGTPFVAANVEWRGDQGYTPNLTLQAGWLWKNPFQRLGQARVFVEHYRGRSPYGQFMKDRETYSSVGFGFDY